MSEKVTDPPRGFDQQRRSARRVVSLMRRGPVCLTMLALTFLAPASGAFGAPTATLKVNALPTQGFAGTGNNALEGGEQGVGVNHTGLTQHTTYDHRVLLKDATGTEEGTGEHLTTITPEAPETAAATEVGSSTATLNGVLNPEHEGEEGTYEFAYRQSATECEHEGRPEKTIPSPAVTAPATLRQTATARLTGLLPGTSYTFCLLVHTPQGEALGPAVTFTTETQAPMISEPSGVLPFSPSMVAGETSDKAGAPTDFSVLFQRGDDQQRIEKLSFKQPAGLAGIITGIPLCPEPQASQGTCSSSSQIGHVVVTSGPGPDPLSLPLPGTRELSIYLTGPYKGAPFGLSIVTPAVGGPFNLGTVITRAKVEVDPLTAQVSVVTDPLPQEVDGAPTDLRSIDFVVDRPGFVYNPTNCEPTQFTGTATPVGGAATVALFSHFGVLGCGELAFHPKISGAVAAHSSKQNGEEVRFDIAYPKAPLGTQAWLKELKLDLPKQLPARLTTLQKACLLAVFEKERQNCPSGSIIGHATVRTEVLPVPLEGPMYDVSYGGAKFPDVVLVLKGDGVVIEEIGEVLIKNGITSTTFNGIPDAPFEKVEVTLPAGPFSQFAANLPSGAYDACGQKLKLVMPTLFKAQNGVEIHQSTPITITGCPKAKTPRAQLLAAALKACHKKHAKKRTLCEKTARKGYGVKVSRLKAPIGPEASLTNEAR
jgi:hypothetical protein